MLWSGAQGVFSQVFRSSGGALVRVFSGEVISLFLVSCVYLIRPTCSMLFLATGAFSVSGVVAAAGNDQHSDAELPPGHAWRWRPAKFSPVGATSLRRHYPSFMVNAGVGLWTRRKFLEAMS